MTNEIIKTRVSELLPSSTFDETGEWLNILIDSKEWKSFARALRNDPDLDLDYLFCVTCVDWRTHFTMVYHLTSTQHRVPLVVKANLNRDNPEIETVSEIWRTAEFHEREAYDLFGVKFLNHPDLRRLFLTEEWIGWPLRKDFEDPINMIKL